MSIKNESEEVLRIGMKFQDNRGVRRGLRFVLAPFEIRDAYQVNESTLHDILEIDLEF